MKNMAKQKIAAVIVAFLSFILSPEQSSD